MGDRGPILTCFDKHGSNTTLGFHECICNFDYSYARSRDKPLKMKHCLEAAEMYKIGSFYSYVIVIAAVFFGIIAIIAAICSCKWYFKTNKNPCHCCSFFCCCNSKKKRKNEQKNEPINVFEQQETGHTWSPINLPPLREGAYPNVSNDGSDDGSTCMNFCLSDPVQDCCEFFDCDIMWRKKSVYTIPIFGRRKQQCHLQRRPTRPAPAPPPPPKAVVLPVPQARRQGPIIIDDDFECEPVPEAPPSPEPIRHLPAKALYVDPLSFLQRPFLKIVSEKKEAEDKQEALYSKFKNMVLSKVKKSVSMASINKLGVSDNPDGISYSASGHISNRKLKTASMASLHNLGDADLETASYGSKRSLSLASLHMFQQEGAVSGGAFLDPRSRISVISSATADDIPPSARKDEYIDLEEMSKRIEAKMKAAQLQKEAAVGQTSKAALSNNYTPNFMPASAFSPASQSSFNPNQPSVADFQHSSHFDQASENAQAPIQYYPPVPASQGKPAVPARTAIGSPIYSMSPSGTLNRQKPIVPPRPPNVEGPNSPRTNYSASRSSTLTRSPRLMKPSDPPPPPPNSRPPIESSI